VPTSVTVVPTEADEGLMTVTDGESTVNATVLNEPPVSASVPTPADDTGGTENVATVGVGHADAATQTGGTTVNGTPLRAAPVGVVPGPK